MNEAQVNETQADDGVGRRDAGERQRRRGCGEAAEAQGSPGSCGSWCGRRAGVEAAELLGVAYRTVVRAEESGEDHGAHGRCAERLLGTGDDPEVARLRERVDALEGRRGGDGEGAAGRPRRDSGCGCWQRRVSGPGPGAGREARRRGGPSEDQGRPGGGGVRPRKPFTERRLDPEVVTEEAADDDPEVYGDAWPLVEEWRRLRADHPHQGKSLSWLTTEERLLVLELAMLEDHGLTLPPEKQPLRASGARARPPTAGRRWPTPGWRCGSGSCCAWCGRSSPCGCGGSRPRSRLRGRFSAVATSERSGR